MVLNKYFFEMQRVKNSKNKCGRKSISNADCTVETIYGQQIPKMQLLQVNYTNPHFVFDNYENDDDCMMNVSRYKDQKFNQNIKKQKGNNIENEIANGDTKATTFGNYLNQKFAKKIKQSPLDTWNVKVSFKNGIAEPYIAGIVPRSSRIEQIQKLNEQITDLRENNKSENMPMFFPKTDRTGKLNPSKCDQLQSDKKIKKLAHELEYKCQCKKSGATKSTQTDDVRDRTKSQFKTSKPPDQLSETDENLNRKIQKLFETRCDHNNRTPQSKQSQRHNKQLQVAVEARTCPKRSNSTSAKCQIERIHLKKTARRHQPLLIANHAETNVGFFNQKSQSVSEKLEHNNRKTCGYKNCTLPNCPISSASLSSVDDKDTADRVCSDNKVTPSTYSQSEKNGKLGRPKKLDIEVKLNSNEPTNNDAASVSSSDKSNDLNDVQNFSRKNLTKATTDKVLLNTALNNSINKSMLLKASVDLNLKTIRNRTFNDLKSENNVPINLKMFAKNSSLSNASLGSDAISSTDSEKDDGYYDQVASGEDSCGDPRLPLVNSCNIFLSKLGCDGAIFWNNCYFYDDNYCTSCCPSVPEKRSAARSSYRCFCSPQKADIHDMRPRSMDACLDSGVSISGDTGSSPDSDTVSQHIQSQADLEARRLKRGHVLTELLETERIYVTEMNSILKGYRDQMISEEMVHLVPPSLQGKEDILFGNLHELYAFHSDVFLKDMENCISTTELVALCFVQRRDTFYRLYSFYCQNIPRSERLRETLVDAHLFLQECQKRLGHKLPLAAYLLKPVQRITKYQLLLKDLLRFSDSGSCTKELQKALDCMLIVLKCVNDSMHQIAITGFPADLCQQGELLLQDSFQVWTESKKDIRLRLKTQHRHIFLYQKAMLFCKQASKTGHNKSTYQFKHYVKMSQIGLTESVRGDPKRFEVWLQGRQEVHTLQAPTIEIKNKWVAEIKKVLLNQLEELKGEKIKQYGLNHRTLRQTVSWDNPVSVLSIPQRTMSCDTHETHHRNSNGSEDCSQQIAGISSSSSEKDNQDIGGWSSDYSNSEDELSIIEDNSTPTILNFLAQWTVDNTCARATKSNSTFYVSVE